MSASTESIPSASDTPAHEADAKCVLHVCTSCRAAGAPREPKEGRAGFVFFHQLQEAFDASPLKHRVDVRPTPCLSICRRPCGIALSLAGSWTYLFGDQEPSETVEDVEACVALYLRSPEGFMARDKRPQSMRRGILGRVPPSPGSGNASS